MKADEISDGARELRNDYQRAWRRKNPHKTAAVSYSILAAII